MSRLEGSEMANMVRDMLGGENEETISENRIKRWLNQAYLEVCSAIKPQALSSSETITTTSGTAEYTFSSDNVLTIDDCVDETNHQPVIPINENQYNQYALGGTSSGNPYYYYQSGADPFGKIKVTFYPTPNGTYSIVFNITAKPAEISTDVTTSTTWTVIPETWDDSIIYRAASRGWYSLGDVNMGKAMMEAARANDTAARIVTNMTSQLGDSISSNVGRALRNG